MMKQSFQKISQKKSSDIDTSNNILNRMTENLPLKKNEWLDESKTVLFY
jgi:hypothetical protein